MPPPFLFPQMIQRRAHRNPRNPVLKRRATIKLIQRPPRLQKCFLREILNPLPIALKAMQNAKDPRLMPLHESGKLVGRAGTDTLQQFGIVAHESTDRRFAEVGDGIVHEIVNPLFQFTDFLTLLII